ncbi:MAG: beta-phosphoglucomutase [Phycisphaerales bacterium]|jgi:beta-phosphoglucomutase|nr:beta-phosphoglucomutase [Phycisphaerales bacterium]
MSRWPHAVLFDFDGVLCNSEPLHFFAFQEVLAAEKIELTEAEYYNEMLGFDDKGAFKHVFAMKGRELDPKTFLRVMTRKSEVMMDLIRRRKFKPLPGVEEFVRGLWRHCPLAICSGALREEIEAMLEGLSLRDCFSVIVAAEDVEVGKPDPRGYLLTATLLSEKISPAKKPLKPADCLIVEDAPTVIREVKKIGFPTLAVATSYPPEKLAEADYVVESLHPEEVRRKVPELKGII